MREYLINTKEYLQFVAECIRVYGYIKINQPNSTALKAKEYYMSKIYRLETEHMYLDYWEMEQKGIDYLNEDAVKLVEQALKWVVETEGDSYLDALKEICQNKYADEKDLGKLASLLPMYDNKLFKLQQSQKSSEHVGSIGERVNVDVKEFSLATSWETLYGTTAIYKIVDADNNVYTWRTSKKKLEDVKSLIGTVKSHKTYKGSKQTELTRCRIQAS